MKFSNLWTCSLVVVSAFALSACGSKKSTDPASTDAATTNQVASTAGQTTTSGGTTSGSGSGSTSGSSGNCYSASIGASVQIHLNYSSGSPVSDAVVSIVPSTSTVSTLSPASYGLTANYDSTSMSYLVVGYSGTFQINITKSGYSTITDSVVVAYDSCNNPTSTVQKTYTLASSSSGSSGASGSSSGSNNSNLPPMSTEYSTNRYGSDYRSFNASDSNSCLTACQNDSQCQAYTFVISWNTCFLKNAQPGSSSDSNCISGVKNPSSSNNQTNTVAYPSTMTREDNMDRYGNDFMNSNVASDPAACAQLCAQNSSCVAFTYVAPGVQSSSAVCYLKNAGGSTSYNANTVSGVKIGAVLNPLPAHTMCWAREFFNFKTCWLKRPIAPSTCPTGYTLTVQNDSAASAICVKWANVDPGHLQNCNDQYGNWVNYTCLNASGSQSGGE